MADRRLSRWLDPQSRREVWLLDAASPADWPDVPPWESTHFGLFIATDQPIEIGTLARRALQQGLAAVAAWGPECSRLEDEFDEEIVARVGDSETEENVVLTTSHAKQTLEEALEFFLDALVPASDYEATCAAWCIFAVGSVGEEIRRDLVQRARERGRS